MSTDTELACALAANEGRRSSFNDTQYDESLARCIQEEEIAGYESTLGEKFPGFGKEIGCHSQLFSRTDPEDGPIFVLSTLLSVCCLCGTAWLLVRARLFALPCCPGYLINAVQKGCVSFQRGYDMDQCILQLPKDNP